ncbi:MAG TPA: O-antigen ligase family protein, partial [Elusimicrobiota bacterium]|nr:O-antigen ligase family protein [Elusimicrobiota bacterium]
MRLRAAPLLLALLPLSLGLGGLRAPWALALVSAALYALWLKSPPSAPPGAPFWLAWLAWSLLSAAASAEPLTGLAAVSKTALGPAFFVLASSAWERPQRRAWLWVFLGCAQVLGWAAALFSARGYPMTGLLWPYYNYTASLEAAALCAAASAGLSGAVRDRRGRLALGASMLLNAAFIARAHSRGAAAAAAAVLAVELVRFGRWRAAAALAAAPLLAAALLPASFIAASLKLDRPGSNERPAIWASALQVAREHPLLGQGPGQFERGFLRHNFPAPSEVSPARYQMRTAHAHSEPLHAAAELGWPGLLLWVAALAAVLAAIPAEAERAAPRAAAMLILLQSVSDNLLNSTGVSLALYSALACACGPARSARPPRAFRALGAAGLLAAACAWWPLWEVERRRSAASLSAGTPRAEEQARAALAIEPDNADLWQELAQHRLLQRPPATERALEALAQAEQRAPTDAAIPLLAGEISRAMGRWPAALSLAERALALEPRSLGALLLRAEARLALGDSAGARRDLRAIDGLRGPELERPSLELYARRIF